MFEEIELKKLKAGTIPNNMIIFDTETNFNYNGGLNIQTLKMAYLFKGNYNRSNQKITGKYHYFDTRDSICKFIDNKCYNSKTTYIYAHNIYFDLQVIGFLDYFAKQGWKLSFCYDSGLTFILKGTKDKRSFVCISTTNYFSFGLAKLGELLGLPKLKVNFDSEDIESLKVYCKRDVEILVNSLENYFNFLVQNDCGKISFTRASQAMNTYRYKFMNTKIMVHHFDEVRELEQNAYYGGRTECFFIGEIKNTNLSCYDINSMYPYVMKDKEYPVQLLDNFYTPSKEQYTKWINNFLTTAEVIIKTDKPYYPVRHDNKLVFPVGEFKTYLSTEELRTALKLGHIKQVNQIALYKSGKIFADYVNHFYDLKAKYKKEGNEIYTNIVKIFLNSLYGKFGQKIMIEETVDDYGGDSFYRHECFDVVTGEHFIEYKLLNKIVKEIETVIDEKSFIGIAAHVTSYARMYLNSLIDSIGFNHVLYCDTDSVYIKSSDADMINIEIDKYNLGSLDLEMEADYMNIYGLKDYVFGDKVKLKGIPKNAKKIDESTYEYDSFLGMKEHLRRGETEGFITRRTIKHLKREYTKGVITPSGIVSPFVFKYINGENLIED